jgi:hypothetical protein
VNMCRHDNKLGRDRVFLKAARDLPAGTEVFVGYGRDYWRSSSRPPAAAAAAAAAATRCPEQAGTGSGSGSGSGEDEAEQLELAGGLNLSSDEDGEQLQQQRKSYPTRRQQQLQQQEDAQQSAQQSAQQQQELPSMQVHSQQQQKQQHEAPPGRVAPAGQGQWGCVGSGLPHPYAGQAAANRRHPSRQDHMLPHLHQQQPVQDAAEAAALPVEPWQLAAALAPGVLQTCLQQGALGVVESATDTDSTGLVSGSSQQVTRRQRACVLAFNQQQRQQREQLHKRQGSLDSDEAECSQDGGGRLLRGRQQQRTCLPTSRLQQQQQQHSRREVSLDSSEAEECAFAADGWQQEGIQGPAAAAAAAGAAATGAPGAVGLDGQVGSGSWDAVQEQQQQWRSWLVAHPQWRHSDSGDAAHGAAGLLQDGQQDDADWQPPGRGSSGRGGSSRRKFKKKEPVKKKPKTRRSCTSLYKDNRYPLKRAADPYRRVYTHSRKGGLQPVSQGASSSKPEGASSSKPEGASSKRKQKRMKRPADPGLYKRVYTQRRHRRLPNHRAASMVE